MALAAAVVAAVVAGVVAFSGGTDEDTRTAGDSTGAAEQQTTQPAPERETPGSSPQAPAPVQPPAAATAEGALDVGVPMTLPACDGSWVVFLGAATDPATYASDVRALLSTRADARYLLTRGSCTSMRQSLPDGTLIYSVWIGPYPDQAAACAARSAVGGAAYVKRMDDSTPAEQLWQC